MFVLDLFTPIEWADWLLYFIPLVLSIQSPRERDPYYFATLATMLVVIGGSLHHHSVDPFVVAVNRFVGITVMISARLVNSAKT